VVRAGFVIGAAALYGLAGRAAAADLPVKAPPSAILAGYDWSGFYAGGHIGYAWGKSDWSTPGNAGALNLSQPLDAFADTGSFLEGFHAGYNLMLPNRFVIGAEADASFPAFPNLSDLSIGGSTTFFSPVAGAFESYSETMLASGTVRGRFGYAAGHWLVYATGGFAWTYDQLTLAQLPTANSDKPFLWRFGWAAGAGIEAPVAPHWTARVEYLFTDYGKRAVAFPSAAQQFTSDLNLNEVRAGVSYHFGESANDIKYVAPGIPDADSVNFHGQTTFTWQGYPAIRSPFAGPHSLPGSGEGRETFDATLYAGVRLWRGAEFWFNPEIDQGFGLASTHGVAGFTSAEAYKIGFSYPYARVQRAFVRQTIDLGGDQRKIDADINSSRSRRRRTGWC
jgi:high affinity Mn2+ porin